MKKSIRDITPLVKIEKAIEKIASEMVTKNDAKNFATRDDLKNFATRDDLKNLATKRDLAELKHELKEYTDVWISDVIEAVNKNKAEITDIELLKKKIERLEEKVNAF